MAILKTTITAFATLLFFAYMILISLLVFKSLKSKENYIKTEPKEEKKAYEYKKPMDEAEKPLSESRKVYYESLCHK